MNTTRPADFDSEGQYDSASVQPDPDSDTFNVDLFEAGVMAHQIIADRVLVGGGLPDEAVEMDTFPGAGRSRFTRGGGVVDVCVRHDDGDTVVWLAP